MTDPFAPVSLGTSGAARTSARADRAVIAPTPDNAPLAPVRHPKLGTPTAVWTYRDRDGRTLGHVHRYDRDDGKEFRPLTYWRNADGECAWRWESWPTPRPLYGLELLARAPADSAVVITEGEKACDALRRLTTAHVVMSPPGGALAARRADWSALRGRVVTIWPDADAAGLRFAQEAAQCARDAGARRVAIIAPPETSPIGWDVADALDEGWTSQQASDLISRAAEVVASPAHTEKTEGSPAEKQPRPRASDKLLASAAVCRLWHGPDGEAYAFMPVGGHNESHAVRSKAFQRWLANAYFAETAHAPGGQAIEDALRVLEARAYADGPEVEPWMRIGERDGRVYIDLADRDWRAVEIHAGGWRVLRDHDLPFIRSPSMRPLPAPEEGGMIEELRPFVNVAAEDDLTLITAWLVGSLRARGPYPVLVLNGEQGSGKTHCSRLLRSLIDPSKAMNSTPPKDERDLIISAYNGHVLAFDNLSSVPAWLADAMCRLSTGGGFSTRALHTDRDQIVFEGSRPMLLNGIPSLTDRPDLGDRAITVRLREIGESDRRSEAELAGAWAAAHPRILGALFDAVSSALRRRDAVRLDKLPRLADFAVWVTAAEPGLGWDDGDFMRAYSDNRREVSRSAFEADPVATAIATLIATKHTEGWYGTPTELLSALNGCVTDEIRKLGSWPKSPQQIGTRIDRIAPVLRSKGFVIHRHHSGVRSISIMRQASPAHAANTDGAA